MIKFIICSDSDIPQENIGKLEIDLLPLIVMLDGVEYRAYRDISGEKFRELMKNTKDFPKTATVSNAEIADKMRVHIENNDEVIMVTMSGKGSATFNVARLAKEQLEEEFEHELPISVVDSTNYSLAYLHPVYDAVKMAKSGKTRQEITDFLNESYKKQQLLLMITDLSYLKHGGRIKTSAALVGGVLGIVPILHVNEGLLEPVSKERGAKHAIKSILRIMEKKCPSKKLKRVQLMQCNRANEAREIEALVRERFKVLEFLPTISPEASVTAHTGMDFVGIAYAEMD